MALGRPPALQIDFYYRPGLVSIARGARGRGTARCDMIETIEIEKCTGCGICDVVCPADVIHMEPVPVVAEVPGLRQVKLLPVIKFREHCITCFSCEIFCPEHIV